MGAIPYSGGTMFRVWAPNANKVYVMGDWNNWNQTGTELKREGNDNFSGDVSGATTGQRYKFVIRSKDGDTLIRNDPRAARVENSAGAGIIHDPAQYHWQSKSFATPGFNSQVIYEMHVGTFHATRGAGPGTWKSAMQKLDYLAELGVNVLQVMPPAEFPGDFSWGYNPSYPFAPESAYGTPEDTKAFVDAAHAHGMGVIFDVVYNHQGPSDLPDWCFDGPCYGNGGIYFYTDNRAATPWGSTRLDYGRAEVRSYIRDNALMWLNEYHLDGLRFDGTKFMRTLDGTTDLAEGWGLMRWISDEVKKSQPWKILIAEDFGAGDVITRMTSAGGAGFDTQWSGEFMHPIRDALIAANDSGRDMNQVAYSISQKFNGQATQRVIYTESHDEVANGQSRVPEAIWPGNAQSYPSQKRSTLGAAITMTSPGIPMIFEGQEFLEDGWFDDKDPVDWSKSTQHSGITALYRDLIHLRRNWYNNTRGLLGDNVNVFHVNDQKKVLAYHRFDQGGPGDDVIIVANFSSNTYQNYRIGLPRGGLWHVRFNSDFAGYSNLFSGTNTFDTNAGAGAYDGLSFNGVVTTLGPYSAVIYSQ
ncbi:MAG: alpha amylase C-terminal domain-containing protein [Chitinophagaceae bacterium]|nr:alpha amylase C-terminal domain-containing protein [Oligoflexus sp.]